MNTINKELDDSINGRLLIWKNNFGVEFVKLGMPSTREAMIINLVEQVQGAEFENLDILMSRSNTNNYCHNKLDNKYEKIKIFDSSNLVRKGNDYDKYCYYFDNNVIYGINRLEYGLESYSYLMGVCFENRVDKIKNEYMPLELFKVSYPHLTSKDVISAMKFWSVSDKISYLFEIIKTTQDFKVKIGAVEKRGFGRKDITLPTTKLRIDTLTNDPISSMEITYLNKQLIERLSVDANYANLITVICSELTEFGKKIDLKHNLVEEEKDILNPQVYLSMPFEETTKFVLANQEELFNVAFDMFEKLTKTNENITSLQRKKETNN